MPETIGFNPEAERANKVQAIKIRLVEAAFLNPNQEQKDKLSENLKGVFDNELKHGTNSVTDIDNTINDSNTTELQKENARKDKSVLTEAVVLAAKDLRDKNQISTSDLFLGSKHMENMLPQELKGLGREVTKSFINNDEIDKQLNVLEVTRQNLDVNNPSSVETFVQKLDVRIKKLAVEDYEDEQSVGEQDAALTVLNEEKRKYVSVKQKEVKNDEEIKSDEDEANIAALIENQHAKDSNKEYRSPYEVTPESFVDAIFNQDSPRLYFTPAPEWVRKLSPKEQYLLKIEQRLANGAATKLGVKDISADKARQNEIYNFPETELKLIYEMPGVKEAMETFVSDIFEPYMEDGRQFLRIKLDGNGKIIPDVRKKLGDIGVDYSFEDYKEEMFKKMALKKLYPNRVKEIDDNCKGFYDNLIKTYIDNRRKNDPRVRNKTDAELEAQWITNNALEEKRAVATAWNFLFVGNIIESADINRNLKPSQINSDKIRTMMMPLEKFLQKASIRKGKIQGSEELFGGNLALWAKRRLEEGGTTFSDKLVYAADHDRTKMTDEQAKWRLMPKRTMCSFGDEYHVDVKIKDQNGHYVYNDEGKIKTEDMTFSEALLNKKEIVFEKNDADVFVSLRDTWDEVISVSPFIIGKGEYSPAQQPEKFASAVEKLKGLVTGINKLRLTPDEARIQGQAFGHEKFVDCPEFYAWLLANAVGLEIELDTPILNRKTLKINQENYDVKVKELIKYLKVSTKIMVGVQEILNSKGWHESKKIIKDAEWREAGRESKRLREEKKEKRIRNGN